ncbi:MAG: phosphate transport system substrate-binding protein [Methanohalophilus sp. T328-1]|nr:MAG: phosphate transport system substrate-binding protein [Methanohalophilus sp. T328-1]
MEIKNIFNNEQAVSPIVATLVLVVVAIAGAAAVGTLMGSFSSDVSEQASVGDSAAAASTEILIAGSTTVQPVSELLAEAYMEEHPGVKITVQGGGSGSGVASTGMDIVDIGSASRNLKDSEASKYPEIQTHQIGGSAVVVIANADLGLTNVTQAELHDAFVNGSHSSGNLSSVSKMYQRSEESGTEDTFVDWLDEYADASMNSSIDGATGNQGVLDAVKGDSGSIGFVDYGYADGVEEVTVLGIYETTTGNMYDDVDGDDLEAELANADGENYATGLTRPLNYLTNGGPDTMEQRYIDFARSPGAAPYFKEIGYFPVTAFK